MRAAQSTPAAGTGGAGLTVDLDDVEATRRLAAKLARLARVGDVIALGGDLGTGKTTFARAIISALGGIEEVPSPTFTLVQIYPLTPLTVWHFDLYRIDRPEEVYELGIEDAFAEGLTLIEWPERMAPLLPSDRLDIELTFRDRERRRARLVGRGAWRARIAGLGRGGD